MRPATPPDALARESNAASASEWSAVLMLLLTSVHHAYGAAVYGTPWRYHVLLVSAPATLVLVAARERLRTQPRNVAARWVFALTALIFPVLGFGLFEGLYNHVLKDALYFSGAAPALLLRLFPAPMYEMPNDIFFEASGVLQAPVAMLAAYYLYRFVK